jgi:hypothetical protein
MSDFLTRDEEKLIKKNVRDALRGIFTKHENRDRSSVADIENPNRQVRKSDGEKAIAKLHSGHRSGQEIAKAAPCGTNAATAISALHADRSFAGREVSGNRALVEKLATVVAQATLREYGSAAEAKREIKKLLSDDAPRPRNHQIVKQAKCKSGLAVMTFRKGADFPYLIEVNDGRDSLYHSEHRDARRAEEAFVVLATGAFGASDVD